MKNSYMKILLSVIVLWLSISLWWKSFAVDNFIDDCSLINMNDWKYVLVENRKSEYEEILPEEAMIKAFDNLRTICCADALNAYSIGEDSCNSVDVNAVGPESKILFDHLLDVYLRRLDAKQSDENWWDLLYWLEPDPVWKEWRDFIINIWKSTDGNPPVAVDTFYKDNWEWVVKMEKYSAQSVQLNNSSRKQSVKSEAKNYNEWNLMDRYYNACNLVMMMYLDIANPPTYWKDQSRRQTLLKWFYEWCENLVANRIEDERDYAEAVMQQQWIVFLNNALNSYLNIYFLENKLAHLEDTIYQWWNKFTEIVKWIDKLVKNCS